MTPGNSSLTILSPLKIAAGPLTGTRYRKGSIAMLCHRAQARLLIATAATVFACSALDLSVTKVPASDVGRIPRDLRFAKPNRDEWLNYNLLREKSIKRPNKCM